MQTHEDDPRHGDFARGNETLLRDARVGSFADGVAAPNHRIGSFADSEETEPRDRRVGSYADTDAH